MPSAASLPTRPSASGASCLLFIVNLARFCCLNWQLALLSVIVVPIIVVMSIFFFRRVSKAYEAYQEQDAVLSTTLQENLTGVRVVKAFARQEYEAGQDSRATTGKSTCAGRRLLIMHSLFWPISDILCGFQMLAGFFVGAH